MNKRSEELDQGFFNLKKHKTGSFWAAWKATVEDEKIFSFYE